MRANEAKTYVSLEDVLGRDSDELTAIKQGEFPSEKLGLIPFSALANPEFKQAKRDCVKMTANGAGGMTPEVDDDKLMLRIIVAAVGKDRRSTFTFADKALLAKFGVAGAEQVVEKLLSPGEISRFAIAVQTVSGFGPQAARENEEAVKNS
ncbi:MAG TPA: hypothetical protein PKA10_10075 [Selenomonadales bacterium]|nr:hypothetical protein [Selenomonadales bacterium]